jgi:type IV pilus assembly protein PilB
VRAYNSNVSDIHIEPFEKHTSVRMRMDGVIVDFMTLQKNIHNSLIARIKILGDLDIAERRIPQDGHFKTNIDGTPVNVRVSVIPTVFGEKAVLRLLASAATIDHSGTFGMNDRNYQIVSNMLRSPNGIIYVTGPTGSGKSTTLYMILSELSQRAVNISTIEDPVEKNLPKLNQMQVNNTAGLTFEIGLRALLRQDPDVIMLGETRDAETASISVRAAITGHLVLSTLRTNDAASSVTRLIDMGIEPYMLANSLVGIIAQRLVRKVCPDCAEWGEPTEEENRIVGMILPKSLPAVENPFISETRCDSSPPPPDVPIQIFLFSMMPPPVPVPSTITQPLSTSDSAPFQASALAAHLPSLPIVAGTPRHSSRCFPIGMSRIKRYDPPVKAMPFAVSSLPGMDTAAPSY